MKTDHFDAIMKARKLAVLNGEDYVVFWDDDYLTYRIAKFSAFLGPNFHDVDPINICYSDDSYDGVKIT